MSSAALTFALFAAGAAGGALNSVAGGGSFIVFPTMLLGGIAPVAANATTTVALWPAGLASAGAYREHLLPAGTPEERHERTRSLLVFSVTSAVGGGLGAKLLLFTSDETFARILPLLMLAAAAIFTFGPRLTKGRSAKLPLAIGVVVQLLIATYGGYFGGGMGIMMLATMTLIGMRHMHEMNALKVVLALIINGVALVTFFLAGKVVIDAAIPVAIGAIAGGWAGASIARRTSPKHVRALVLVVAWSLTAWFFYRSLRR